MPVIDRRIRRRPVKAPQQGVAPLPQRLRRVRFVAVGARCRGPLVRNAGFLLHAAHLICVAWHRAQAVAPDRLAWYQAMPASSTRTSSSPSASR